MQKDELMMSDIPSAVAWYGHRACVGIPLQFESGRSDEDFYAIHNRRRQVAALYLTRRTLDEPLFLLSDREPGPSRDLTWGRFAADILLRNELPVGFGLRHAPGSYLKAGHLLLADRARWQ
jgi:hypothetical protein